VCEVKVRRRPIMECKARSALYSCFALRKTDQPATVVRTESLVACFEPMDDQGNNR